MTDRIKDGGPAFPTLASNMTYSHGMTIRDWLAGQAMGSIINHWSVSPSEAEQAARTAYALADAMLSAREGKQ